MDSKFYDPASNTLTLEFDSKVYSLKAIKNAAYDYTNKATIQIETSDPNKIVVYMTPKSSNSKIIKALILDFKNHILDHQIRIELNAEFKVIREMIVAQAFQPVDNLQEIIDTIKP